MNLKQIFAKLDSLEEEHGHGRFRVNLDWSVEVLEDQDQEKVHEQDGLVELRIKGEKDHVKMAQDEEGNEGGV